MVSGLAGAVMDENQIGRCFGKALQAVADRILTLRPARDRGQQGESGGGGVIVGAIVGMNDDANRRDGGMLGQRAQGMPKHHPSAERQVLLRQRRAEACAASGGDDEGDARGHGTS